MASEVRADQMVPRAATMRAGLTFGSAALVVGAVVTAFVLAGAFEAAHRTIGWVVACSVVALLVDPIVDLVARVMPRWLAVVNVLLVGIILIGSVIAGLARDVSDSLGELEDTAPSAAASLEEEYDWLADIQLADRVDAFIDDLNDNVRRGAVSGAVGTVPTYLVTGILMLFLLAYGRRYFDSFVAQFAPARRERLSAIGRMTARRGQRYLLITLGQSIVNGLVVGLTCWALDLPAAASLGVLAGALTIVPLIGVVVGGLPALLLAFGLEGWGTAVVVLVVLLGLQAIDAAVVRPYVDARTVRIGPTVPIVVGLLGFELYGIGGAIYGVAVAVLAMAALDAVGTLRAATEPTPA